MQSATILFFVAVLLVPAIHATVNEQYTVTQVYGTRLKGTVGNRDFTQPRLLHVDKTSNVITLMDNKGVRIPVSASSNFVEVTDATVELFPNVGTTNSFGTAGPNIFAVNANGVKTTPETSESGHSIVAVCQGSLYLVAAGTVHWFDTTNFTNTATYQTNADFTPVNPSAVTYPHYDSIGFDCTRNRMYALVETSANNHFLRAYNLTQTTPLWSTSVPTASTWAPHVAVDERYGTVYVADSIFAIVRRYTVDGQLEATFSLTRGAQRGGVLHITALDVDSRGNLYIADQDNRQVKILQRECKPGYYGPEGNVSCQNECPGGAANPCNGHGTCRSGIGSPGTCDCNSGFWGTACQHASPITLTETPLTNWTTPYGSANIDNIRDVQTLVVVDNDTVLVDNASNITVYSWNGTYQRTLLRRQLNYQPLVADLTRPWWMYVLRGAYWSRSFGSAYNPTTGNLFTLLKRYTNEVAEIDLNGNVIRTFTVNATDSSTVIVNMKLDNEHQTLWVAFAGVLGSVPQEHPISINMPMTRVHLSNLTESKYLETSDGSAIDDGFLLDFEVDGATNRLFILHAADPNAFVRVRSTLNFAQEKVFGSSGTALTELQFPSGVQMGPDGLLVIQDRGNRRIVLYNTTTLDPYVTGNLGQMPGDQIPDRNSAGFGKRPIAWSASRRTLLVAYTQETWDVDTFGNPNTPTPQLWRVEVAGARIGDAFNRMRVTHLKLECNSGFYGPSCKACVSTTCSGRGACSDGLAGNGQCVCVSSLFTGDACELCAPGYQSIGTSCVACEAGKYRNASMSTCEACSKGTFQGTSGQSSCDVCPAGEFSAGTQATACFQCSEGQFSAAPGSSGCQDCLVGQFSPTTGQTTCQECPLGHVSPAKAAVCSSCPAGWYNPNGTRASSCSPCSPGYIAPSAGSTSCTACPVGTRAATNLSTVCTRCPVGYFANATASTGCYACDLGRFSADEGVSACSICASGKVAASTASTTCTDCTAGTIAAAQGASTCSPCGEGFFAPAGSAICQPCASGTYSNSPGASACLACPAGNFTEKSASRQCLFCAAGKFRVGEAIVCEDCASGAFSNVQGASTCSLCPPNSASSADSATCLCNAGYFSRPGTTLQATNVNTEYCTNCPPGAVCAGGSSIVAQQGFYQEKTGSFSFKQCVNEAACKPQGCADGHTGPLCSLCKEGYGLVQDVCQPCPPQPETSWALIVLAILAILGYIAFIIRGLVIHSHKAKATRVLRVYMNYLQLMGFAIDFPLSLPPELASFLSYSKSSNVDVSGYSVDCTVNFSFVDEFTATLLSPVLVIVLAEVLLLVWAVMRRKGKAGEYFRNFYKPVAVLILYLFHPIVSKKAMSVFACEEVDGQQVLLANVATLCSGPEYDLMVAVSAFILAVYTIGGPLIVVALLRKNRDTLWQQGVDAKEAVYYFLYDGFRKETYYWEVVIAARKLLIMAILVFLSASPQRQVVFAVLVIQAVIITQVRYLPFKNQQMQLLEFLGLLAVFLSMLTGLMFQAGALTPELITFFTILLFAVNVSVALYAAVLLFEDVLSKISWLMRLMGRKPQKADGPEEETMVSPASTATTIRMTQVSLHASDDVDDNGDDKATKEDMDSFVLEASGPGSAKDDNNDDDDDDDDDARDNTRVQVDGVVDGEEVSVHEDDGGPGEEEDAGEPTKELLADESKDE